MTYINISIPVPYTRPLYTIGEQLDEKILTRRSGLAGCRRAVCSQPLQLPSVSHPGRGVCHFSRRHHFHNSLELPALF